jgi:hypothetical protein
MAKAWEYPTLSRSNMSADLKQKNLFESDSPDESDSDAAASIRHSDSKNKKKDKYWWEKYSLYRSGWHRFWFAMFVTVCLVIGCLGRLSSEKERAETFQYLKKVEAEQCEKSCFPKAGYMTYEPINPLHKPPNNVGRNGPRPRCNCS